VQGECGNGVLHLHPKYRTEGTPRLAPLTIDRRGPEREADLAISYLKNEHDQRDLAWQMSSGGLRISVSPGHLTKITEAGLVIIAIQTTVLLSEVRMMAGACM